MPNKDQWPRVRTLRYRTSSSNLYRDMNAIFSIHQKGNTLDSEIQHNCFLSDRGCCCCCCCCRRHRIGTRRRFVNGFSLLRCFRNFFSTACFPFSRRWGFMFAFGWGRELAMIHWTWNFHGHLNWSFLVWICQDECIFFLLPVGNQNKKSLFRLTVSLNAFYPSHNLIVFAQSRRTFLQCRERDRCVFEICGFELHSSDPSIEIRVYGVVDQRTQFHFLIGR